MLSKRLNDEFNKQIMYEFYSAQLYLAMAAWAEANDFPGLSNFMVVQGEEERFHAMKFFRYIAEAGGDIEIFGLDQPEFQAESIMDIFASSYKHEQFVTSRIYTLMDIAQEEKDYAAISFLNWFVDEQMEEEASFDALIKKVKLIGENGNGLYQLDKELASRVFTPPAAN